MIPPEAFVAALAGFERMTTARLKWLLAGRSPQAAFAVATGAEPAHGPIAALFARSPGLDEVWSTQARRRAPERCWQECVDADVTVVRPGDPLFPAQLLDDPSCPAALFVRGDLAVLDARRVGVVGTRNATQSGRQTAARFGHELAAAGVVVVSGLARGIDGAAHRGALAVVDARPVAVVGNGPDQPYPAQHAELWAQVATRGALISEWPPGTKPDAFRFPLRNRILAALVEVLVVIESRERGGSLITAREAAERGVEVFAVPGPLGSRASTGTNQLLRDGAAPATDVVDVLVALGLDQRRAGRARFDSRPRPRGEQAVLLEACRVEPRTLESLAAGSAMPLVDVAMALARLERAGWVRETAGWFEAVDEWADLA
jgi:DNA processing protein